MLINKCYLKDIREYEERTGKNILRLFDKISISNMVTIIGIFNGNLSEDEIYIEIDKYLENNSIIDLYDELRNELLGYKYQKSSNTDNNDNSTDNSEDITSYKFLTDFYMKLCMQLMALGITYSEFWTFSTGEMYQVFYGIQQKMVLDYNTSMQIAYNQAALIGSAVWGKLPSSAPRIESNRQDDFDDDEMIDTPMGQMTRGDYNLYMALEKQDIEFGRK